jgi:hypothetical protein
LLLGSGQGKLSVSVRLDERLDREGPLPVEVAVSVAVRVARRVERLHADGKVHGRLGLGAVELGDGVAVEVTLASPESAREDDMFWRPERAAGEPPCRADDVWAIAMIAHCAMTGWRPPAPEARTTLRPPPLAVFDAGDDSLEQVLEVALSREPSARPRSVPMFRRELESWLVREGHVQEITPNPTPIELALEELQSDAEPGKLPNDEPLAPSDEAPRDDEPALSGPKLAIPLAPAAPRFDGLDDGEDTNARPEAAALAPRPSAEPSTTTTAQPPARPAFLPALLVAAAAILALGLLTRSWSSRPQPEAKASAEDALQRIARSISTSSPAPLASTPASSPQPTASTPPLAGSSATLPSPSVPASSIATAEGEGAASAGDDPAACLARAFPEDTFVSPPALGFVCSERSAILGAKRIRERVAIAGHRRGVTSGMREWALLGFFEIGAYATLRDRCCVGVEPLELPSDPPGCPSLRAALGNVSKADEGSLPDGLEQLGKVGRCIARSPFAAHFGDHPAPSGGEGTMLRRILRRLGSSVR